MTEKQERMYSWAVHSHHFTLEAQAAEWHCEGHTAALNPELSFFSSSCSFIVKSTEKINSLLYMECVSVPILGAYFSSHSLSLRNEDVSVGLWLPGFLPRASLLSVPALDDSMCLRVPRKGVWSVVSHFGTRSRDQGWKNTLFFLNELLGIMTTFSENCFFLWSFTQVTDTHNMVES